MKQVTGLTRRNFDEEVVNRAGPSIVDFYASWCGPCRTLAPAVERLAREHRHHHPGYEAGDGAGANERPAVEPGGRARPEVLRV